MPTPAAFQTTCVSVAHFCSGPNLFSKEWISLSIVSIAGHRLSGVFLALEKCSAIQIGTVSSIQVLLGCLNICTYPLVRKAPSEVNVCSCQGPSVAPRAVTISLLCHLCLWSSQQGTCCITICMLSVSGWETVHTGIFFVSENARGLCLGSAYLCIYPLIL